MRVVKKAVHYPKVCAITGRSDGTMLDTGVFIPASGRDYKLYLRKPAIEKMGLKVGMVDSATYDQAVARIAELEQQVKEHKDRADKLENLSDALEALV